MKLDKYYITTLFFLINTISICFCQSTKRESKNILFIIIDDLKTTLGCYGDTIAKTPNIDNLSANGTVFRANYCQQALCGPSRASILTGMRPDITKVWDLKTKMRDKNPEIISLPQYLALLGYQTAGIGKVFDARCVDDYLDRPSWSIPFFKNSDNYYSTETGKPAGHYQLKVTKDSIEKIKQNAISKGLNENEVNQYIQEFIKPSVESADVPDNAYLDGATVLHAKDILLELSKNQQPFFLAVGIKKPHLPFVAPKKYWDLYKREDLPLAKYQNKSHNGPELAYHNSSELYNYTDTPEIASFSDQKVGMSLPEMKQRELVHGYYAATSYADAQVGVLINTIKLLNLSENTIVVLCGDHGWHLGDHNLWCKHTNFEQATKTPLIISVPNIKTSIVDNPSELVDIFPTLCEAIGQNVPKYLDGNSLIESMENPDIKVKDFAVSQYPRTRNKLDGERLGWSEGQIMGYSIRTENYRYTIWMKNKYRSTEAFNRDLLIEQELYDYALDPNETNNVVNVKEYKSILDKMKGFMTGFLKSQEQLN